MRHDSPVAPLRCIYAEELPAEWKQPFAPPPAQLRQMAEQLHIRTDQVKAYVVFSGPRADNPYSEVFSVGTSTRLATAAPGRSFVKRLCIRFTAAFVHMQQTDRCSSSHNNKQ